MKTTILILALFTTAICLAGWERTYGGSDDDEGYSVAQTSDGGYIVAGRTRSFGAGEYDVYLVKTDGLGDTIWTRTYGGGGEDLGYSVALTSDGGYIVAGYTGSFGAGGDVYLVKTDAVGDTILTRTYGGSSDDWGYSVAQTSDGGYIVAGRTASFGAGGSDIYLIKTDSLGYSNTKWYDISRGWNLLSYPFTPPNAFSSAFPFAMPPAYGYNPTIADYYDADSVVLGKGFWLLSSVDTVVAVNGGSESHTYSDTLFRGWNLIGSVNHPIPRSLITTDPPGLCIPPIYGWNGIDYFDADTLYPGKGYWFLSSGNGRITVGP